MGAKQSYMGSLEGGAIGAATGALSGAGNAALMTNKVPGVNFGITYNNQTGFAGNLGFGAGGQNSNWTAGGFVQFQENEGITGFGMNAGYGWGGTQTDPTSTVGLAFNYDRYGNFLGGQGTYGENLSDNWDMNFGLNFDADGNYSGTSIGGGYRRGIAGNGENSPLAGGHYRSGLGITFHQEGGYDLTLSGRLRNYDRYSSGFNGFDMSSSTTVGFNTRGGNESINQNVNVGFNFQTEAMAMEAISLYEDALNEKLKNGNLTPEEIADTKGDLAALGVAKARIDPTPKIKEYESGDLMAAINTSEHPDSEADAERIKQLHEEGKILSNEERHELAMKHDAITNDNTRDTLGERLLGPITDAWNWLSGDYSSVAGYINENGEWEQATCFVKGTIVWGYRKNIEVQNIKLGDIVWSWNEKLQRFEPRKVTRTFIRQSPDIYWLTLRVGGREYKIGTTWSHRFYVVGRGWTQARYIKSGDRIATPESLQPTAQQPSLVRMAAFTTGESTTDSIYREQDKAAVVVSLEIEKGEEEVYNLTVEGNHNYFVGGPGKWVLVHNENYNVDPRMNHSLALMDEIVGERVEPEPEVTLLAKASRYLSKMPLIGGLFKAQAAVIEGWELWGDFSDSARSTAQLISSGELEMTLLDDPMRQEAQHLANAKTQIENRIQAIEEWEQEQIGAFETEIESLDDKIRALDSKIAEAESGGGWDTSWDAQKRELRGQRTKLEDQMQETYMKSSAKRNELNGDLGRLDVLNRELRSIASANQAGEKGVVVLDRFEKWTDKAYAGNPQAQKRAQMLKAEMRYARVATDATKVLVAGRHAMHLTNLTESKKISDAIIIPRNEIAAHYLNEAGDTAEGIVKNYARLRELRKEDYGQNYFYNKN